MNSDSHLKVDTPANDETKVADDNQVLECIFLQLPANDFVDDDRPSTPPTTSTPNELAQVLLPLPSLILPLHSEIENKLIDSAHVKSTYPEQLTSESIEKRETFLANLKLLVELGTEKTSTRSQQKEVIDKALSDIKSSLQLLTQSLYKNELRKGTGKTPEEREQQLQDLLSKLADEELQKAVNKLIGDEKDVHGQAIEFYQKSVTTLIHEIVFQAITYRQGVKEFSDKREKVLWKHCESIHNYFRRQALNAQVELDDLRIDYDDQKHELAKAKADLAQFPTEKELEDLKSSVIGQEKCINYLNSQLVTERKKADEYNIEKSDLIQRLDIEKEKSERLTAALDEIKGGLIEDPEQYISEI